MSIEMTFISEKAVEKSNTRQWVVALWLLLFTLCLLLVGSGSSPLHPYSMHFDTSWFFMAGKAWMNGLTPYVDFADSKGPLLWLIYGIGYLITPHSFYGVFIFEVLSYWLTFYVLYLTARLFLGSAPRSMVASMLMAFLFFYPGLHQETRIEDFSQLFNVVALYIALKTLYFRRYKRNYALYLGLACGCMLMMKYSYFLTLLIPSGMIFLFLAVEKGAWGDFILRFIAGLSIVVVPFIIYFLLFADLGAFIKEYFLNTGSTILNIWEGSEVEGLNTFKPNHGWPLSIGYLFVREHYLSYFMTIVALGFMGGIYYLRKSKWAVWTIALWYVLSILLFSIMGTDHARYYINLSIFGYALPITIAYILNHLKMDESVLIGGITVGALAIIMTHYIYSEHAYGYRDKLSYDDVAKMVELINEKERQLGRKPAIAYYFEYEKGEHILTNALPGNKYWSLQAGMTDDMFRQMKEGLFYKKPDFVVIGEKAVPQQKELEEAGYKLVLIFTPIYPIPRYSPPKSYLYMFDRPK